MDRKSKLMFFFSMFFLLIYGCITMGSNVSYIKKDVFINKYIVIKKVIIEEAANGGFASLTGEIKPSQYNNWSGQLYFSLKTPNGTDQF